MTGPCAAVDEGGSSQAATEARGKGQSTGIVPSSANYISFDADDATDRKKRKAAEAAQENAKVSKKGGKRKPGKADSDDDKEGSAKIKEPKERKRK